MRKLTINKSLVVSACISLVHAVSPAAEMTIADCEPLLREVIGSWGQLNSVEFNVAFESEYVAEYLDFREDEGYPLKIKHPSSRGVASYFAEDTKYGYDLNHSWGNGSLMRDEAGAWNGSLWQRLNRYPEVGAELEISKTRKGSYEATGKYGSPFEYAFPFLKNVPNMGSISEDGWQHAISIERLANEAEWLAAIAAAERKVEIEEDGSKELIVLTLQRGYLAGDRSTKAKYRIWLDRGRPSFPVRVQTIDAKTNDIVSEFEAHEFEAIDGIWIPTSYSYLNYDSNPGSAYGNRPYKEMRFTVKEASINKPIRAEAFSFDASLARSVVDLTSGRTIRVK